MKKTRVAIMLSVLLIATAILVQTVITDQFSLTKAIGELYDTELIKPSNDSTLVISAPITYGQDSESMPYFISDDLLTQISDFDGVDAVYPISMLYNSVMYEGVSSQYNYLNKYYKLSDEVGPDVNYDTVIDLATLDPEPFLTDDEYKLAEDNQKAWTATEGAYGSLVSPRYSLPVIANTTISDEYQLTLLTGVYPKSDSDELLISDKLAITLCASLDECSKIDSLVGTDYEIDLTGWFKAATIPDVTMTGTISGIYLGNRGHNDVITSYQSSLTNKDTLTKHISEYLDIMNDFPDTEIGLGFEEISFNLSQQQREQFDDAIKAAMVDPDFGNYPQLVITTTDKQAVIDAINDLGLDLIITEYEETT